jgi:hypothetical protein
MLKALVEEMNRYNEPPEVSLRMLNVKPEFDNGNKYTTAITMKGVPVTTDMLGRKEWNGNPLQSKIEISYKKMLPRDPEDTDDDFIDNWDWEEAEFMPADLQKIDPQSGTFIFMNKEGEALTLTRVKEPMYNYMDAF